MYFSSGDNFVITFIKQVSFTAKTGLLYMSVVCYVPGKVPIFD
jgi:hypothetical protein